MELNVSIDYVPRPWQSNFEKQIGDKKRAFLLWARRHGKDIACWNYLILKAIEKRGSYYYLYPRQNQARKAIWEGMTSTGKKFLDYIPKGLLARPPNNQEMMITLVNGSIIRILGSDNYDSFRSTNPIGVVLSEYAFHNAELWPLIIEPILKENKGWALFNTTPFGRNHAYDIWRTAQNNPEIWYTEKVTNDHSHMISDDEFELMKQAGTSEETIRQEYYCDFDRGVDGSYYGRILTQMRLDERIGNVPKDDHALVHTAWDLGFSDSMVIWFYQLLPNGQIRIIDHYENHGEALPHYMTILDKKKSELGYLYGSHYFPHDGAANGGSHGTSYAKYAAEFGVRPIVLNRVGIDIGIERVRKYLPRCLIDAKKCDYGLKCLEGYRKARNEKMNCYAEHPLHDWASHTADAFRYVCQAIEEFQGNTHYSLEKHRELKAQHRAGQGNPHSILGQP